MPIFEICRKMAKRGTSFLKVTHFSHSFSFFSWQRGDHYKKLAKIKKKFSKKVPCERPKKFSKNSKFSISYYVAKRQLSIIYYKITFIKNAILNIKRGSKLFQLKWFKSQSKVNFFPFKHKPLCQFYSNLVLISYSVPKN